MTPLDLIHRLDWAALPSQVQLRAELCLLDLVGIAAGGTQTRLSAIIHDHAAGVFGGTRPMLFDGRTASPAGVALAAGMTIDSLDGHDGYNPAKGHIGCPLLPALLALAPEDMPGIEFMAALVMGYEFGARVSAAQHATVADYHTSGSWGAVVAAAAGARLLGLSYEISRHALGIAEYHGPRSQMMRCIDHPTMLKDGSGWGSMAGVSAALLAKSGFTGAPAITVEDAPDFWDDIGTRWRIMDQYFKPYPVCRWAQAPVEGVLALARAHDLTSDRVERIEVATFHESVRLATARPRTTEEAQYSTSFPCAVALVRGGIGPEDITGDALDDPEIVRLSTGLRMTEDGEANALFPGKRVARVSLLLKDGTRLDGGLSTPRWDATDPPTEDEIRTKFHAIAGPLLGSARASAIESAIHDLPKTGLAPLAGLICQPISRDTVSVRSA